MNKILARTLLNYSTSELWDSLIGDFILKFDDGVELQVNYKETVYSSYFWDFHRKFKNLPLLSKHHVKSVLQNGLLTSETHKLLLGNIYNDIINFYNLNNYEKNNTVKMIYQITNNLYNELIIRCQEYVTSLDILDLIEIMEHPELKPVIDNVEKTEQSIENAYKVALKVINGSPDLINNPVARSSRSKLIKTAQLLQCVAPRGYLTDIDSVIFSTPITNGYVKGIVDLGESMIESRSAAKSLYFSEEPLKDAEYFSRRLQLLCMSLENLHEGDCGSQEYLLWRVKGAVYDENGKVISNDHLRHLIGKYYLDEETNTLKDIKITDKHLIGKTIKLRDPVAGCNHPDPHGICSVCFGKMSINVPSHANLGHICSGTMTKQTSQNVLSTKHYDGNAQVDSIILNDFSKIYLSTGEDGNSYYLNKDAKNINPKLIINSYDLFGLNDIFLVKDLIDLNLSRISRIEKIALEDNKSNKDGFITKEIINLDIMFNGRIGMLTYDFLEFIKIHKWVIDDYNNFVFDLKDWDFTKPFIKLPNRQFNMSDHSSTISSIIEAKVGDLIERNTITSPASTLYELFETVNSKLDVNLSLLSTIIYASMIINPDEDNYAIPQFGDRRALGVASITIPSRSLSAAYAYENLEATITNPKSFFKLGRMDNPMDAYTNPECVQFYESNKFY